MGNWIKVNMDGVAKALSWM